MAERQSGVISVRQLVDCGFGPNRIARTVRDGWLFPLHPGVYAVGRRFLSIEGRLTGALLYAGPTAALSHTTAGWWWGLVPAEPRRIHVSTLGRSRSDSTIAVHHPYLLPATCFRGLPVTTVPRTLLDLAAVLPYAQLRRALAEADYRRLLQVRAVERALGRGRTGSAALRQALDEHLPDLALTRSVLEERFLALCEAHAVPMPEVNAVVSGLMVDALWRGERVIVELDGSVAHGTASSVDRDRDREVVLREAGLAVIRYSWRQITREPERVAADLKSELGITPSARRTEANRSRLAG